MIPEKLFLKTLEKLKYGTLELVYGGTRRVFGDGTGDLAATVVVERPEFFSKVVFGGEDGAGEAYMSGDWWSPDLVSVIRVASRNLAALASGNRWFSAFARLAKRIEHLRRANTVKGSKRNIAEHYDLSNDFFRLFLDESMMYSCAVYEAETDKLEDAQFRKLDRLCQKLDLTPDDHLLEIGTGWGAFAAHAVSRYGCRVTTTTISQEQHKGAAERFARMGPDSTKIDLLFEDYRALTGKFDKIVSIEMFEAVGLNNYDHFFGACERLLKPEGSLAMQAITMNEQNFPAYHVSADWIQRRIFPGAELASLSEVLRSLGRVTSMTMLHLEDIGMHYALTLAEWRRRFLAQLEQVKLLGFDDRFIKMWDYYLAYCEGGFRERYIGDVQLLLGKMHASKVLYTDPKPATAVAARS
jgi:cyclopropane-fatty-acyl-phospholipid synthase